MNVSLAKGIQSEVRIAADPSDPAVLLAGSNDGGFFGVRAYLSRDGGETWEGGPLSRAGAGEAASCSYDPSVAIDSRGRQLFSFINACGRDSGTVYVVRRSTAGARWHVGTPVARLPRGGSDDQPKLAVDTGSVRYRDRAYLAWTRFGRDASVVLMSHSDDAGRSWSSPITVSDPGGAPSEPTVAVSGTGDVYVSWYEHVLESVAISRSPPGGERFGREVPLISIPPERPCTNGRVFVRAQSRRCVGPVPVVSVDTSANRRASGVYVTYAAFGENGSLDVFAFSLPRSLDVVSGRVTPTRVTPAERAPSDQFLPVSAVDPETGALWVCFYDTRGDRRQTRAFYSCTASDDRGRTWLRPVRAASVASDETSPLADNGRFGLQFGDYVGLAVAGGVAHPIWTDTRKLSMLAEEIYTTRLSADDLPTGGRVAPR